MNNSVIIHSNDVKRIHFINNSVIIHSNDVKRIHLSTVT